MTERAAMDPALLKTLTAPPTGPGRGTNRRKPLPSAAAAEHSRAPH
jgi:hypothetical protein